MPEYHFDVTKIHVPVSVLLVYSVRMATVKTIEEWKKIGQEFRDKYRLNDEDALVLLRLLSKHQMRNLLRMCLPEEEKKYISIHSDVDTVLKRVWEDVKLYASTLAVEQPAEAGRQERDGPFEPSPCKR